MAKIVSIFILIILFNKVSYSYIFKYKDTNITSYVLKIDDNAKVFSLTYHGKYLHIKYSYSYGFCHFISDTVIEFHDLRNKLFFKGVLINDSIFQFQDNYLFPDKWYNDNMGRNRIHFNCIEDIYNYPVFFKHFFETDTSKSYHNYLIEPSLFTKNTIGENSFVFDITNKCFMQSSTKNQRKDDYVLKCKKDNTYTFYTNGNIISKGAIKMNNDDIFFYDDKMGLFFQLKYNVNEKKISFIQDTILEILMNKMDENNE